MTKYKNPLGKSGAFGDHEVFNYNPPIGGSYSNNLSQNVEAFVYEALTSTEEKNLFCFDFDGTLVKGSIHGALWKNYKDQSITKELGLIFKNYADSEYIFESGEKKPDYAPELFKDEISALLRKSESELPQKA